MTFQANIPAASTLISVSQNDILQNFTALGTSWTVNHVDFNAAGDGKHKFVEMPAQTSDPAGSASQVTIFSRTLTLGPPAGIVDLWYKRNNEGVAFQLTGPNPNINTGATVFGSTFLPGGLLLQWKICSANNTGAFGKNNGAAITFPVAFSAAPYSIQLSAERNGTTDMGLYFTSPTSAGFTLRVNNNANTSIHVLAIGPV